MKRATFAIVFLLSCISNAKSLQQRLECQKNLVSSIEGLYNPKDGYFFCDDPTTECYLAYATGETYKIELPKNATYVMNENFLEMADKRQRISHHLLTWVEPKSNQSSYVDVFWGENRRGFAKEAVEANTTKFSESKPIKIDAKLIDTVITNRIDTQMQLIQNNLAKKSYPPGWDSKKYEESATRRIKGCDWHFNHEIIQKLVKIK